MNIKEIIVAFLYCDYCSELTSAEMKSSTAVFVLVICLIGDHLILLSDAATENARRPANIATTPQPSVRIQEQSKRDASDPLNATSMQPIARLFMIQAKKREIGPIFKEISLKNYRNDKNHIIRQEFEVQVKLGDKVATGWGDTKRSAKRKAATAMLRLMGLQVDF